MSLFVCKVILTYAQIQHQRQQDSDDYYDRMFTMREEELFAQRGY